MSLGATTPLTPDTIRQVNAVFAAFDKPATPGCAVGVVRDGALVYGRGYGRASVELDVPITTATVFDIGSVSKQFTAASILLLAADGALSLDDDVRKYVPEVPAYERPITIRHLLTHTSGLRDYTTLLALADYDLKDITTVPQALDIVARQRGLDFLPGDRFLYSNTGFFLASIIVERVSRQPLAAFAASRIFGPLGMRSTRYAGSHSISVPHRATGYVPDGGGSAILMSNWEQTGDGGVQTSVEDMVRWTGNFDGHVVGSADMMRAMETTGALTSGAAIDYGVGQFVGTYRGLRRVYHGGSWGGFKAALQRFPAEKTSIVVLCNRAEVNPVALAEGVADAVLGARMSPVAPAVAVPAIAFVGDLARFAGAYWSADQGRLTTFEAKDGALALLRGDDRQPLIPWGPNQFVALKPYRTQFTFDTSGAVPTVERLIEDRERVVMTRQSPWTPSAGDLSRLAGTWQSDELGVDYVLRAEDGRLVRMPRRSPAEPLVPVFDHAFRWGSAVIRFASGEATFEVLTGDSPHGPSFGRRAR